MISPYKGKIFDAKQWRNKVDKYGASCTLVSDDQGKTIKLRTDKEILGAVMVSNQGKEVIASVNVDTDFQNPRLELIDLVPAGK